MPTGQVNNQNVLSQKNNERIWRLSWKNYDMLLSYWTPETQSFIEQILNNQQWEYHVNKQPNSNSSFLHDVRSLDCVMQVWSSENEDTDINFTSKEWFSEARWTMKMGWISVEKVNSVSQKASPIKVACEEINLFKGGLLTKEGNPSWISLKC